MAEAALAGTLTGARAAAPLLAVRDLHAWYGESHMLHGVDFDVAPGEVVTLLGRNGAGKTTTLRAIMGMIGQRSGSITFDGDETDPAAVAPHRPARHRLLPGGARHLREPIVEENLMLPPARQARRHDASTRSTSCSRTCRSG